MLRVPPASKVRQELRVRVQPVQPVLVQLVRLVLKVQQGPLGQTVVLASREQLGLRVRLAQPV